MKTEVFIDISPPKNKKLCSNCKHFSRFGVVSGLCMLSRRNNAAFVVNENWICGSFKKP